MELHLLCGKSPFLWIKAILSHEWSKIRLYSYPEAFDQTLLITRKLGTFSDVPIEIVPIVGLMPLDSMRTYSQNFEADLIRFSPAPQDAILFYSGTVPQLALLVSKLSYKSLMKYESGKFIISGYLTETIDEYSLDLNVFLNFLGYNLERSNGSTMITIMDSKLRAPFKSSRILSIDLSFFGKIILSWRSPKTSGQRKATVNEMLQLNILFGRHLIENKIEDPIIENWLKNVNLPFEMEGEEE